MKKIEERSVLIDNIRGLLIIFVVLGHVMERVGIPQTHPLYVCFYSFHMPAFAFVSGLCFSKGKNRIFRSVLLPYFLVHCMNYFVRALVSPGEAELQFTTPLWSYWYLLALAVWRMLAGVLDLGKKNGAVALMISVIAALLVGFDFTIGPYLALARTILLLPYFLAGAYIKENWYCQLQSAVMERKVTPWKIGIVLGMCVTQGMLLLQNNRVRPSFFLSEGGYVNGNNPLIQIMVLIVAVLAIGSLFCLVPKRKIAYLSWVGRNTMPVYLAHGPVLFFGDKLGLIPKPNRFAFLLALGMTAAIVVIFSMPPIVALCNWLLKGVPIRKEKTPKG